ncbi:unnamed protein product [Prunus armeniaca]
MRAVILLSQKLSTVIKQAPLWNEFTCWKKFLECHGFSFHCDTSHSNKFSYNYDQSHARRLGTESKKRYHPIAFRNVGHCSLCVGGVFVICFFAVALFMYSVVSDCPTYWFGISLYFVLR